VRAWRFPVGILPIVALVIAWEAATASHLFSEALLPSPGAVAKVFVEQPGMLGTAVGASMLRVFIGVSLAAITAIPFGLLLGRYEKLYRVMTGRFRSSGACP